MMMLKTVLYGLLGASFASAAAVNVARTDTSSSDSVTIVHQFAAGTWAENLAVRSNGNLLVTLLSRPELHQIDPSNPSESQVLYTFPDGLGLLGITELERDTFAVIAGQVDLTTATATAGTFGVWKVQVRGNTATASVIANITSAQFLNGITTLPRSDRFVLISDSTQGVVYGLDTKSGMYAVVLSDETMVPGTTPPLTNVGINGIQTDGDDRVYFTNLNKGLFVTVPISRYGTARGNYEVLSTEVAGADDFALSADCTAYIAANPTSKFYKFTADGKTSLAANSTLLANPTAVQFGRRLRDKQTVYITTASGVVASVNVGKDSKSCRH